jgi:hypothetical protein
MPARLISILKDAEFGNDPKSIHALLALVMDLTLLDKPTLDATEPPFRGGVIFRGSIRNTII